MLGRWPYNMKLYLITKTVFGYHFFIETARMIGGRPSQPFGHPAAHRLTTWSNRFQLVVCVWFIPCSKRANVFGARGIWASTRPLAHPYMAPALQVPWQNICHRITWLCGQQWAIEAVVPNWLVGKAWRVQWTQANLASGGRGWGDVVELWSC